MILMNFLTHSYKFKTLQYFTVYLKQIMFIYSRTTMVAKHLRYISNTQHVN